MIQRAGELVPKSEATRELLVFYEKLLESQKQVYEHFRSCRGWLPSGSLVEDLPVLKDALPKLLRTVESYGPEPLSQKAGDLLKSQDDTLDELLLAYWHTPSDKQFFAKAIIQPYARWLAESGGRPIDRTFASQESRCPFCGGMPQVSVLQITEASSESGNRHLICAVCLTQWSFRRVVCAYCEEERPDKLGYFHTQEYDHVRVEACDTCKHYIKAVDLTEFGLAIPLVDEIASAALDVWAQAHGYTKIELNLVGV